MNQVQIQEVVGPGMRKPAGGRAGSVCHSHR